jgi:hypothetical protein
LFLVVLQLIVLTQWVAVRGVLQRHKGVTPLTNTVFVSCDEQPGTADYIAAVVNSALRPRLGLSWSCFGAAIISNAGSWLGCASADLLDLLPANVQTCHIADWLSS